MGFEELWHSFDTICMGCRLPKGKCFLEKAYDGESPTVSAKQPRNAERRHAAGAEQARQFAETSAAVPKSTGCDSHDGVTGHRPAGTADAVAQVVAEGNAAQLAVVTRQLEQVKAHVAEMEKMLGLLGVSWGLHFRNVDKFKA